MNENIQMPEDNNELEHNPKDLDNDLTNSQRQLDWKDFLLVIAGIAIVYFGIGYLFF